MRTHSSPSARMTETRLCMRGALWQQGRNVNIGNNAINAGGGHLGLFRNFGNQCRTLAARFNGMPGMPQSIFGFAGRAARGVRARLPWQQFIQRHSGVDQGGAMHGMSAGVPVNHNYMGAHNAQSMFNNGANAVNGGNGVNGMQQNNVSANPNGLNTYNQPQGRMSETRHDVLQQNDPLIQRALVAVLGMNNEDPATAEKTQKEGATIISGLLNDPRFEGQPVLLTTRQGQIVYRFYRHRGPTGQPNFTRLRATAESRNVRLLREGSAPAGGPAANPNAVEAPPANHAELVKRVATFNALPNIPASLTAVQNGANYNLTLRMLGTSSQESLQKLLAGRGLPALNMDDLENCSMQGLTMLQVQQVITALRPAVAAQPNVKLDAQATRKNFADSLARLPLGADMQKQIVQRFNAPTRTDEDRTAILTALRAINDDAALIGPILQANAPGWAALGIGSPMGILVRIPEANRAGIFNGVDAAARSASINAVVAVPPLTADERTRMITFVNTTLNDLQRPAFGRNANNLVTIMRVFS